MTSNVTRNDSVFARNLDLFVKTSSQFFHLTGQIFLSLAILKRNARAWNVAAFCFQISCSRMNFYSAFKEHVIGFSVNLHNPFIDLTKADVDRAKSSFEKKGAQFNESFIDKFEPGICASLCFEMLYHLHQNRNIETVLKKLLLKNTYGGCRNTLVLQHLYESLINIPSNQDHLLQYFDDLQEIEKRKNQTLSKIEMSYKALAISSSEFKKQKEEVEETSDREKNKATLTFDERGFISLAKARAESLKPFTEYLQFSLTFNSLITSSCESEMRAHVKSLSPGIYFLSLNHLHAMLFIKVDQDKGYIFDPNVGILKTLSFESMSNSLYRFKKTYIPEKPLLFFETKKL